MTIIRVVGMIRESVYFAMKNTTIQQERSVVPGVAFMHARQMCI